MQPFTAAFLACIAFLALVLPAEAGLTNAERFRRGLPPLPPVKRSTGTWAAKRVASSPVSLPTSTPGVLQVRYATGPQVGSTVGYVNNNATSGPIGITRTTTTQLEVKFEGGSIKATNALFPGPLFIGGNGTVPLATASPAAIEFVNVEAGPFAKIWSLDPASGTLNATWTNPDNTTIKPSLIFDQVANTLNFTGDSTSFISASTITPAPFAVTLYLVAP